jgi:iron uptake system component EfeO
MTRPNTLNTPLLCLTLTLAQACTNESDANLEDRATLDVKDYIDGELNKLVTAAEAIEAAAPKPDADGWNVDADTAATDDMKAAWADARDAYEHVEGAIAVLFPGLDVATDARYDAFIEVTPDDNLFDDKGVTGMHAIERILWADWQPASVVAFESALDGYVPAATPVNKQEADDFKNELAARLVKDVKKMRDDFKPLALDSATAFRGIIGSIEEQREKVVLAATAEDESRYAQRTLDDMRANLEGGQKVYAAFEPWVKTAAGDALNDEIKVELGKISDAYEALEGSAIPMVPEGFNPDQPTDKQLATDFGQLWTLLTHETDPEQESLVARMLEAADAMGIPQLAE